MRRLFTVLSSMVLMGCAATQEERVNDSNRSEPVASDVELVHRFLDALYRSGSTSYRVIPDAESEEAMDHIPSATRNRDLSDRLRRLRTVPNSVISVTLHSGDRPEPWGSGIFEYSYDTKTGAFTPEGIHQVGGDPSDMWIDVRHWPDGTRLVSLSHTWIDDLKDNIFHLRKGERTFRFAIAIKPLID